MWSFPLTSIFFKMVKSPPSSIIIRAPYPDISRRLLTYWRWSEGVFCRHQRWPRGDSLARFPGALCPVRSSGFVETNRLSKRNADEHGGIMGISWGDYDILICFLY
jgi:hypothetical protein